MVDILGQAFGFTESHDHQSHDLQIEDYEKAAESSCEALEKHATGQYSNSWPLFKTGNNLFDKGLPYIDCLMKKLAAQIPNDSTEEFIRTRHIQLFLEKSALYYYKRKDAKSFMAFVRRFTSVESQSKFLSSLGCLTAARLHAGVLMEADFLVMAGCGKLATNLLLWYMFYYRTCWANNYKLGLQYEEDLCQKIRSLARDESNDYFYVVCTELKVFFSDDDDEQHKLKKTKQLLLASQRNNSIRGEILSIRKILDYHLLRKISLNRYDLEDNYVPADDLKKHCEEKMFQEQVCVTTLVFYWNMWKENVVRILNTVSCLDCTIMPNRYVEFSLNYFGVRKLCPAKGKVVFVLVDKDAEWIRKYGLEAGVDQYDEKLLTIESKQLMFAVRSYWQSQLFSVGIKVLKTLEMLHNKSKSNGSAFHQSMCLLNIFEVSKFFLDCKYLNLTLEEKNRLQKFLELSMAYFDHVFPLDWRESVSHGLVSLIETDLSVNLLDEILHRNANINGNQAMGRVMMLLLFPPRKTDLPLRQMITSKLDRKFVWHCSWSWFLGKYASFGLINFYVAEVLQHSLAFTWKDFQMLPLDMSPHSFLHLLDCALFMDSCCLGKFFTAKSSFVGWITHLQSIASPCGAPSRQRHVKFQTSFIDLVTQILSNKNKTKSWIRTSKIKVASYYPLLTLRMVMMLCLICLEDPCSYSESLHELLFARHDIASLLPKGFVKKLKMQQEDQSGGFHLSLQRVSEAFMSIGDPLLIVSSSEDVVNPMVDAPPACAIFVDLTKSKEEIMSLLFPTETAPPHVQSSLHDDDGLEMAANTGEARMNWDILEEIYKSTNVKPGEWLISLSPVADTIKKELKRNQGILHVIANEHGKSVFEDDAILVRRAAHQLEKLSYAVYELRWLFDPYEVHRQNCIKNVHGLVEMLQGSRPRIDEILSRYVIILKPESGLMKLSERGSSNNKKKAIDKGPDYEEFDWKFHWWHLF